MHKKKRILLLASVMMFSVIFTGCQAGDEVVEEESGVEVEQEQEQGGTEEVVAEVDEDEDYDEAIELGDWEGTWNNMAAYLDDEELEEAFKELAERDDMSVEQAKEAYVEDRKVNFDGFIVEGNTVTFLDAFKDKDGGEIETTDFEYDNMVVAKHGNFDTEWYSFKAKKAESAYPVLLLMPVHGEEALTHFHLRYGDSVEELLALEDWYPTFVSPNSTYGQIYEEVTE